MDFDEYTIEVSVIDDDEIIESTPSKVSEFFLVDNASVTDRINTTGDNIIASSRKYEAISSSTKVTRKRGKHRKVDPECWKRNKNAKCREKGEEYIGRRMKLDNVSGTINRKYEDIPRKKKELKERCHCKTKNLSCMDITDEMRQEIFDKFWALEWKEKRLFVCQNVRRINIQRPRHRKNDAVSRRSYTFQYYLPWHDKQHQVCKLMFNNTTCISSSTTLTWKNQQIENSVSPTPAKSKRFSPESERLRFLNDFLAKLPSVESYCGKDTKKLVFEPSWKTKAELYEFYKKEAFQMKIAPMSSAMFNRLFANKNYSLYTGMRRKKG